MSHLRIIEGSEKGKLVKAPPARDVRPTSNKTRQALFNVLRSKIQSSRFLDVCAGSGVIGLEAMSRGAAELTIIEENRQALSILNENIDRLGYKVKVIRGDCLKTLLRLSSRSFDLIFADPPYKSELGEAIAQVVASAELLADDGWLVIEHYRKNQLPERLPGLILFDDRHYGQTTLSFYRRDNLT
jgi:16S rRNA (guanine966-N2)-methyltransferase